MKNLSLLLMISHRVTATFAIAFNFFSSVAFWSLLSFELSSFWVPIPYPYSLHPLPSVTFPLNPLSPLSPPPPPSAPQSMRKFEAIYLLFAIAICRFLVSLYLPLCSHSCPSAPLCSPLFYGPASFGSASSSSAF